MAEYNRNSAVIAGALRRAKPNDMIITNPSGASITSQPRMFRN